jgi:transketolase
MIHVDWNNASIDADNVCSDVLPGQYVNWKPQELGLLHGYNVVYVNDGTDSNQIKVSQDYAFSDYLSKKQKPSMLVYRTLKGEGYMEGRKSHGAGYKFDSNEYFGVQKLFETTFNVKLIKTPEPVNQETKEEYLFKNLQVVEAALKSDGKLLDFAFNRMISNRDKLNRDNRKPKSGHADISVLSESGNSVMDASRPPEIVDYKPGSSVTLRESLGKTLSYLNNKTKGGFYGFAADLVGSTSLNLMCVGFPDGFIGPENQFAKIIPTGICEDGGSSIVAGISATGHYVGVGSSYATFISPMAFTAARLYAIAYQAKQGKGMAPLILINAHAGLKTGEDGPTHACPQPLSMWKSFGELKWKTITLTPWDPNEIWPLIVASLKQNPVLIVPFVTRPAEVIVDRKKIGFPEVTDTVNGIYYVRKAKKSKATVIYQGAEVGVELPNVIAELDKENIDVNVLYVSSSELFSYLPKEKQEQILPEELKRNAMAVTGFTLDTMNEYILTEKGRDASLHPFKNGIFLGSGPGGEVLKQAGLDVKSQLNAIRNFVKSI